MTEYYELKVNLLPSALVTYKENIPNLYSKVIPRYLTEIFDLTDNGKATIKEVSNKKDSLFDNMIESSTEVEYYSFYKDFSERNIQESIEYKELMKNYNSTLKEYKKIVDSFQSRKGIYWPNTFLESTKPKLNKALNNFKNSFPDVYNSSKYISTSSVTKSLPGNNQFGHSRRQLIEVLKIKKYLTDHPTISKAISFIYTSNEHILINLSDIKEMDESISLIQNSINSSQPPFGEITIIPIYSNIFIDSSVNSITYSFVYPNGENGRKDRNMIEEDNDDRLSILKLLMNDDNSEKDSPSSGSVTINTKEGLTPSFVNNTAKRLGANKGYLADIRDGAKAKIKRIIKKVKLEGQ